MNRVAVLGAGVMGETLMAGMLRAGWAASDVVGAERRAERRDELAGRHGVRMVAEPAEAVAHAEVVLVVVKPQDVDALLPQVADALAPGAVVISLCAGVTLAQLERGLPAGTPVVRVMPNTPAQVGEGMAALSPGTHAGEAELATAVAVMGAVGRAVVVPERYQDAVTGVSGSGPAYLFLVAEALIEGGVHCGLTRDVATQLAVQTLYGSAKLLVDSGEHPAILRERVTSPAGTTAAGLRVLEERGVRAALLGAVEAARDRSVELGG